MNAIKLGFLLILVGFAAVIIPIVFGTSPEITLVTMVIGLVITLVFFSLWTITRSVETGAVSKETTNQPETKHEKIKGGGVIMIGPLPIVFGTDKKYAIIAIILAIVLMMIAIVFIR
jgi:uncharacterized protein (TIGR00304 family)